VKHIGIGLDFGTTNSSIALAAADGSCALASFSDGERDTTTFRSVLHFTADEEDRRRPLSIVAGPRAITSYLETSASGRFIQSLKSHLASKLFEETFIFGWKYTLTDLIAIILRELRAGAREQFGEIGEAVCLGRPAHFVTGADATIDDALDELALERLRQAAGKAGFGEVRFEFEPVAAAYEYERQLDHDELVLIGDFGGGTSDFCLIELGPSWRGRGGRPRNILGVDGVPVAGGRFDGKLVRSLVAPKLGLGSLRRSELGKSLPVPAWIYGKLERWEDLSFLKSPATMETLKQIKFQAAEPRRIESLIRLVDDDLGYALYRAIERTKLELSDAETSRFVFKGLPLLIQQDATRAGFDALIEPELTALGECVDRLLGRSGVGPAEVDRVFLTGGSSLVPCVRALFARRFGVGKLRGGEELTTVARGLALTAAAAD
jgi:hypothetical chaperone protein